MEYAEELCMLARLLLRKILQLLIYIGSDPNFLSVSIGMVTRQMFWTPLGCVQAKKDM